MTEEELKKKLVGYAWAYYEGEGADVIQASILAAFAELRAERDAVLERERVLREDMTGISNLDQEMYIGGALAMLAINIAKRALGVKP